MLNHQGNQVINCITDKISSAVVSISTLLTYFGLIPKIRLKPSNVKLYWYVDTDSVGLRQEQRNLFLEAIAPQVLTLVNYITTLLLVDLILYCSRRTVPVSQHDAIQSIGIWPCFMHYKQKIFSRREFGMSNQRSLSKLLSYDLFRHINLPKSYIRIIS